MLAASAEGAGGACIKMSYDVDTLTEGCYPGTTVLINNLSILDEASLREAEALATYINASQLEANPIKGAFDFEHYKAIHRFLFEDIYGWAGEIRTVNMSKKGTPFCECSKIESRAKLIFERLAKMDFFRGLEHDAFVEEIVDFYCSTNALHPFREGNGRAQRAFITQLIRAADYDIQFSEIDTDLLMLATMQAAQGVTDNLKAIFQEAIE